MSRPWEVLVTVVLLVLLSPLLLLGALTVLLTSGRPVLFRQQRVGQGGTSFTLLKLRTMPVGTSGHAVTVAGDTRVSGVARLLRASRIDELPQLVNVLRGDMALVGPRPEVPGLLGSSSRDLAVILAHRPGLTDPASLAYRNEAELLRDRPDPEAYYAAVLRPAKSRLSAEYLARRSSWTDLVVLWHTARCLLHLPPRPFGDASEPGSPMAR